MLLATWPEGTHKPAVPAPYAEEVWTGLEYMMASHLIARGLVDEGLTIVRAARARHDGSNRNPWNDIECGSYYARSLSSYALINAYLGLSFDARNGEIGIRPANGAHGTFPWSAGKGWGNVTVDGAGVSIEVLGGELNIASLSLPLLEGELTIDGVAVSREGALVRLGAPRRMQAGERLVVRCSGAPHAASKASGASGVNTEVQHGHPRMPGIFPVGYFPNLVKYQGGTGASGNITGTWPATTTARQGGAPALRLASAAPNRPGDCDFDTCQHVQRGRRGYSSRPPCSSHARRPPPGMSQGQTTIELPGPVSVARLVHRGSAAASGSRVVLTFPLRRPGRERATAGS